MQLGMVEILSLFDSLGIKPTTDNVMTLFNWYDDMPSVPTFAWVTDEKPVLWGTQQCHYIDNGFWFVVTFR